jgi:hypothetical protein
MIQLKPKILLVLFITLCVLIIIRYGWFGYSILTERPGLIGSMHYYYQLTRPQAYLYYFAVAGIATALLFFQLSLLFYINPRKLSRTFWMFILFIVLLIVAEIYLYTKFTPSG